jgi:hypothetical protein
MRQSTIHFEWAEAPVWQFRTGVSLHSHTLYSHETLDFIYRLARRISAIRWVLEQGEAQYRTRHGSSLDLTRAWWTPPCAPHDAWLLESHQVEGRLQLNALVSLTDHDSIEAPLSLHVLDQCRNIPVSVEWTVPYGPTFFHLGVHNLPADTVRKLFRELAQLTAAPEESDLSGILKGISEISDTLVVFNHPCWDESEIGAESHLDMAAHFLRQYGNFIHALELNGLRPWSENRMVLQMARAFGKPVVSGGDRHALEPNTILDLTNASTFSAYVEQVRSGKTDVLVTNQYRESFGLRILQSLHEILQDHDEHGRGWRRWVDRVFYRCDDGVVRSFSDMLAHRVPTPIQLFVNSVALFRHSSIRNTFRLVAARKQEFAL